MCVGGYCTILWLISRLLLAQFAVYMCQGQVGSVLNSAYERK